MARKTSSARLFIILLVVVLLLFLYYRSRKTPPQFPLEPIPPIEQPATPPIEQPSSPPQPRDEQSEPLAAPLEDDEFLQQDLSGVVDLEEPVHSSSGAQYARHANYTVCYSTQKKHPVWVAYQLTADETNKLVKRHGRFKPDAKISNMTVATSDYKHSGFDRGHLAPAADMSFSNKAMEESFFLSNVCPQYPEFNRGIWKSLEEQVRDIARTHGAVYVVTGPIVDDTPSMMNGKIPIPKAFFKVLMTADCKQAVAFLMPHTREKIERRNTAHLLASHMISVDSIERITGLDFFPRLPDAQEVIIEAQQPNASSWGLR